MGKPWIGANLSYKRKKCTIDQKILKKVLVEVSKVVAKDIKQDILSFKQTGALYFGIGSKVVDPKKDYRYVGLIGVKNTRYSKQTKKGLKIPNLYARKANTAHRFIQRSIAGKDSIVRDMIIQARGDIIQVK